LDFHSLEYYKPQVVAEYPHDPDLFTEGLFFVSDPKYGEVLYESSGLYGSSKIVKTSLKEGKTLNCYNLPSKYFGEGISLYKDKIVQLTYKARVGFVYDYELLKQIGIFKFETKTGEGWGLTSDGENLIMSDGSDTLYFFKLKFTSQGINFKPVKELKVHYNGRSIYYLNELEYINGEIWACLYNPSGYIVRINPHTGEAIATIDLRDIFPSDGSNGILNGIAWDKKSGRIFVTGKWCPAIYEIKIYGVR
jgi:glutamine cyclotransferase